MEQTPAFPPAMSPIQENIVTEPPSYPHTRLWGAQLALGTLVFILAESIGQTVMIVAGLLLGEVKIEHFSELANINLTDFPRGTLIGSVVCAVLVTVGYWGVMRLLRGPGITEIARPGCLSEFGRGLLLGTGLMGAVILVLLVLGSYRVIDVSWNAGILMGLGAGIMAGFAEEIFFRGLLFRLIEAWLGTWGALTVTALIFGLMHLRNPEASLFGALAIALEAGILLGACYVLTRRLWLAIGVHLAWNFVQGGIFGSDISGTGSGRGLIEASFPGPDWLTGGAMGIEGSMVTVLICTAVGVYLLYLARQRGQIMAPSWARKRASQPIPQNS